MIELITKITAITAILLACNYSEATMTERDVQKMAVRIGLKTGVDPALLVAIAKVESNFNPEAIGKSHKERGLMQLHPKYFPKANFKPNENMNMAANYLKELEKTCKSRGLKWYTCYNTGPNKQLASAANSYYKKVEYEKRRYRRYNRSLVSSRN
jgi:soluble lytic murein transglycosylase-like protein